MNQVKLIPCDPQLQKFGVFITGVGRESTAPGEEYPHNSHSAEYYFTWERGRALANEEFQILYIAQGSGKVEFRRDEPIAVSAGSVIVLHPGEWHRYRPDADVGWSEMYIGLGGESVERLLGLSLFAPPPNVFATTPGGAIEQTMHHLVNDILHASASRPFSLALRALGLLALIGEMKQSSDAMSMHDSAMRQANLHIAQHFKDVIDFRNLAQSLGMGYSRFRSCFRDFNGLSPLESQLQLRVRHAQRLLSETDMPISEVAGTTGFQSAAYFARQFRVRTAMSPGEYRAKFLSVQRQQTANFSS